MEGYDLAPGTPPQDHPGGSQSDWSPFTSQAQFETAEFLFKKVEMSQADTDNLMRLWAATTPDGRTPFRNHQDMLTTINAIDLGDIPWQNFSAKYSGTIPPTDPPDWMLKDYTVHFRDPLSVVRSIISNPDFKNQFDYAPYREFENGKRHWTDVMSGDWVWNQAVQIPSILMICRLTVPLGHSQQRPRYPWVNDCPTSPGKRQNFSFEHDQPKRIPSGVLFHWKRSELCLSCASRCPCADWLLSDS